MIPLRKWLAAPFRLSAAAWRSFRYWLDDQPVITPKYECEKRKAICSYCRHNDSGMCGLCACFIDAKVLLSSEQCPDSPPRWNKIE